MSISFSDWIKYIFDHPVTEPAWYWQDDEDWLINVTPALTVTYMTRVFENAKEILQPFSNAQLNQSLWYLSSNSCSDNIFALVKLDNGVAWSDRQQCIRSIFSLFAQCFALRCSPHLSHIDEPDLDVLNSACYMWWDVFPWSGHPNDPNCREMDEEFIKVMQMTLELDSDACRESALHGLGHWQMYYPEKITAMIDNFLSQNPKIRTELKKYALNARLGYVQ